MRSSDKRVGVASILRSPSFHDPSEARRQARAVCAMEYATVADRLRVSADAIARRCAIELPNIPRARLARLGARAMRRARLARRIDEIEEALRRGAIPPSILGRYTTRGGTFHRSR